MNFLRHFFLALQFFTRIPLPERLAKWVGFSAGMQRASLAYFPLIGWLVGGAGACAFYGLMQLLPPVSAAPWVAAILSTVLTVMLTGAFHEDGLADLADGIGGAVSRERALEIMKDSRIGSYGTAAMVLAFLLKTALLCVLAQVDVALAAWTLFAAHVCSRLMPVWIVALLPSVSEAETSKSLATAANVSRRTLLGACFWTSLGLSIVFLWRAEVYWIGGIMACVLAWLNMLGLLRRRLQGFTGDALGATQQVCELAFYLGVLLCLPAAAGA